MSQLADPRRLRSQIMIRDAFMALLLEQRFDQITVSTLVRRAGVNRATFYRHYVDIYDLAHRLTDVLFLEVDVPPSSFAPGAGEREWGNSVARARDLDDWAALFEHVATYAPFYRAMLQPGGIPGFRERVETAVAAQMAAQLHKAQPDESRNSIPVALAVRYIAAGQVGFMQWWLENDMPFPPREAAAYLLNLHFRGGVWALGLDREEGGQAAGVATQVD